MPLSSTASEDGGPSSPLAKWCRCQCAKIRLCNPRIFMAPPLITLGSSLAEFVVVFSITGFMAIDVVAISAVCFSVLLSLAALLFIRFDRLTVLAYLMLSVSLLSSSTFLVICIQRQSHVHDSGSAQNSLNSQSPFQGSQPNEETLYQNHRVGRHGSKLVDLMRSGTELRWIHQLQSANRCCGYWNFTDWLGESSLLDSNKTFKYHSEPIHPPTKWMVSCCDRNLTHTHSRCRAETIYDDWHDIVQYLYQKGCGVLLDNKLDQVHYELLKTSIGLSFWDILIAADLVIYTLWKKLRRAESRDACNIRNGTISTEDDDVFT